MSVEAGERTSAADAGAAPPRTDPRSAAALVDAAIRLFTALRRLATAELALLAAEVRVLRASIAMVVIAGVALVAFAVSLWVCIVALIGWAFVIATHSVGLALGLLVVLHLILVGAVWLVITRAVTHAGFPRARAELAALGHTLRRDLDRFQHPSPPTETRP